MNVTLETLWEIVEGSSKSEVVVVVEVTAWVASVGRVVALDNQDVACLATVTKVEWLKMVSKVISVGSKQDCSRSSDDNSGWWPCEEGHGMPVPKCHVVSVRCRVLVSGRESGQVASVGCPAKTERCGLGTP